MTLTGQPPEAASWPTDPESSDYAFIANLAHEIAGIALPPSKAPMMRARLIKRLRALKMATISQYCDYLRHADDPEEVSELINVLTTNVTNFYRERHHFDYLRQQVLPSLIERARTGGRIRLWSAACSSGEEAVSLALDVIADCPEADQLNIRILATDIDRVVLAKAKRGVYVHSALEPVIARHGKVFLNKIHDQPESYKIADKVRSLITYRALNLVQQWPVSGPFQVVFCRNVLIYFDGATQNAMWPKFRQVLDQGAHLFIGHSERIEAPEQVNAETVATTTYRFA